MKLKRSISRLIFTGNSARLHLLSGISHLNQTTQLTLGPKGRNVILDSELGLPKVTKDGVTVAKSINFFQRPKELGASLIKNAAH
jgi:chaperonin GroEL